jgi:hypothetical protein
MHPDVARDQEVPDLVVERTRQRGRSRPEDDRPSEAGEERNPVERGAERQVRDPKAPN